MDIKTLKENYWKFSTRTIAHLEKKLVHSRTSKEILVERMVKEYSRADVYHSFWIGPHCVDIFIPRYKLAIEVGGSVHNHELKMRKDNLRDERLMGELGITVWDMENKDAQRLKYELLNLVKKEKPKATRVVRKMWRDIYIETLARVFHVSELERMLGYRIRAIASEMNWMKYERSEENWKKAV